MKPSDRTFAKSRIAVTMGDPAGVGPEVCLHLLADEQIARECVPVVFGDAAILRRVADSAKLPLAAPIIPPAQWQAGWQEIRQPTILDCGAVCSEDVQAGVVSAATGRAGFTYVERAIEAAIAGQVAAVSTAPLNKEALHAAGVNFPGHTEIFAARTNSVRSCMMQYSEEITCTFVTVHVGYSQVPGLLTKERILEVIELTAEALARLRGKPPKIVVCGLNPHAGEHGLFGDREEERIIIPAIEAGRAKGIALEGPLPPDTAFLPWKRKATDAFVCMYHDQGHIPVKALAFDSAVNTTLGLPIIRTSVDHGTACDIAWQGKASPSSIFHAVRLAIRLAAM
ncbi:MAG: 4-hydroxythreonine-4-phosphate dehydrogenase PdxA [Pirellulaceae bacterium]|nr:4-hydroxythreonine-4-phosphate dehydrogenase PdxA [Pirellulaceae bacterium]